MDTNADHSADVAHSTANTSSVPARKATKAAATRRKPTAPVTPKPEAKRVVRLFDHPETYGEMHPDAEPLVVPGMIEDTTPVIKPVGLCLNCAHRTTCKLPRAEGGVWHCEEYE
jgi:hypothetical protein